MKLTYNCSVLSTTCLHCKAVSSRSITVSYQFCFSLYRQKNKLLEHLPSLNLLTLITCNCVFSNSHGTNKLIQLQLQEYYFLPILTYAFPGLRANANASQIRDFNVCWNSVYKNIPLQQMGVVHVV